ncbi:MAG: hypothetical protein IT366_04365 [Candidatus Hydrogenedentes bacterium]|nr:hypothetical protein [Candidatus Hydrogenedentota bacterium]
MGMMRGMGLRAPAIRDDWRGMACVAASLLATLNITACTSAPRITVADDLVVELRNAGVPIETQEPAPMPSGSQFRFDEGVRVKGQGLFVDILRIEDRRVFDIAKSAGRLLVVAEAVAGQPIPDNPSVYARHPFVVIIRQQPEGLALEHTLAKMLPPEPE